MEVMTLLYEPPPQTHTRTHHIAPHAQSFNLIRFEIQYKQNIILEMIASMMQGSFFEITKRGDGKRMSENYFQGILLLIKLFPFCKIKFHFLSFLSRFLPSDMENAVASYIEQMCVWHIKAYH